MRWFPFRSKAQKPDRSRSLVVFRCTEQQAAELDDAAGPYAPRVGPRGGHLRPLASPLAQWSPDSLDHLSALYTVVSGKPRTEALRDRRAVGPGTIAALSDDFVTSLAALSGTGGDADAIVGRYEEVADRWFVAVPWPDGMRVRGLTSRLLDWAGKCQLARKEGMGVYCWHGPRVPAYVIAHGVEPESYAAFKRNKRRR